MHNVAVLKESLKSQLVKVVQIDKSIEERRETLDCLVEIAQQFESEIPDESPDQQLINEFTENKTKFDAPVIEEKPSKPDELRPNNQRRMIYRSGRK